MARRAPIRDGAGGGQNRAGNNFHFRICFGSQGTAGNSFRSWGRAEIRVVGPSVSHCDTFRQKPVQAAELAVRLGIRAKFNDS